MPATTDRIPTPYEIDRVNRITAESCMAVVNWAIGRLREPCPPCSGKGIVIPAGGPKYLREAYVTCSVSRRLGSALPIQVWHLGPKELTPDQRAKFNHLGVELVDAHEMRLRYPARRLKGWELKSYAVAYCPFAEVLLLDADCRPARQPEWYFEQWEYERTGCVLWPDVQQCRRTDTIFSCLGLRLGSFDELESGQQLIDKARHWRCMVLCRFFNNHSDFFYSILHGDKDLLGLAFEKLGVQWTRAPKPTWEPWGIHHYWPTGESAFYHRMENKRTGHPIVEDEAIYFMQWDGTAPTLSTAPVWTFDHHTQVVSGPAFQAV